jgi:hypothetical protein
MKYLLMIYADENAIHGPGGERPVMEAYAAYTEAMIKAGVMAGGNRLERSSAATTVRVTDGKTQLLNGPYAESREQLGGYYVIEASDLDAALQWAARCPGASHGAIEVRPIAGM